MATVILVRHGRSTANVEGILAGRAEGVDLDEVGRRQAERAAERLAAVPLVAVVSSPLARCRQTAGIIAEHQAQTVPMQLEPGIVETDYGQWQGRLVKELAQEPLWSVVQSRPSAAVFPGGESLAAMQARSVEAIRRHDAALEAEHGAEAVWVAVSHGDIIATVLGDALGMDLDLYQRLTVTTGSVSIVRYGSTRPQVVATNTDSGDLSWLRGQAPVGDAQLGGAAHPGTAAQGADLVK
ncbi:MSMEG_4193 family putative phosphomutase [Cellulomonas sp. URHE0023]|uniref:MSMEG_4193 family putative phosphomutase n=1 Tax=Cellulomonas sp. URHE0023 TaxID=1380354 RepID=UPI00048016C3|nr:MSMEG_4193 family putative phosphomutase [Cellulomonas sp. URHE0023]